MPANLTPQYIEAEEQYRQAKTPEDRLVALKKMLQEIPKHKGTEKLQAELKRKISEQKKAVAGQKAKKKKGISYSVDSQGYPQVAVVGAPNSGRSQLLSQLTATELKVADYPYTTRIPHPVMLQYENIKIQLVDTPPISALHTEPWMPGIVRAADAVLLVADLGNDNVLEELEAVEEILGQQRVLLGGDSDQTPPPRPGMLKRTLLVANKQDLDPSATVLELLRECYSDRLEPLAISAKTGAGLDALKQRIFLLLAIIRVYPKPPGKKADLTSPIILSQGSNVIDFANKIHHDLAQNFKSARIWNSSDYIDGQRIPGDYRLQDGNIVELE